MTTVFHFLKMQEFDPDRFTKMAKALEAKQQQRIDRLLEITDAEVDAINGRTKDEVSENQIFSQMTNRPEAFFSLTGYHIQEFEQLFSIVESALSISSRGRKTPMSKRDILFLVLYYLRRYPRYEEASAMLSIRVSTFQNMIQKNIPKLQQIIRF